MKHYPTTLEYIEERDEFAVYADRDGDEHFRDEEGTFVHPRNCEDCDTLALDMTRTDNGRDICDECRDEHYSTCNDCYEVVHDDDTQTIRESTICDGCADQNYRQCWNCDERHYEDDGFFIDSADGWVCDGCRESNFTYCDACDEYEHDDYECSNREQGNDCCDAPGQQFSFNHGETTIDNDERVTISLPAGMISDVGIGQIAQAIRSHAPQIDYNIEYGSDEYRAQYDEAMKWNRVSYSFADKIGSEWQNGGGNFTKRLSRFAHQSEAIRLSPALVSSIGNIAREHSNGSEVNVEMTRDLNQSASDFYHEDSCWWQSYYESRCALKSNGGIGMRTFSHSELGYVTGRAWVMPLKFEDGGFAPTFDTRSPDAYIVFNGYGDLEGYAAARIVASMTGLTYRKVSFSASPMYVNSDAGYLVAPESLAAQFTDGSVRMPLAAHANIYNHEMEHANA